MLWRRSKKLEHPSAGLTGEFVAWWALLPLVPHRQLFHGLLELRRADLLDQSQLLGLVPKGGRLDAGVADDPGSFVEGRLEEEQIPKWSFFHDVLPRVEGSGLDVPSLLLALRVGKCYAAAMEDADFKHVTCSCRCGECCRRLLIEAEVEDAEREPKIAAMGSPLKGFDNELVGYLLNSRDDMACVFLDRSTNRCTIYGSRPLLCRVFDCGGEGREQLIELGILER